MENFQIEKKDDGFIEIKGEISVEEMEKYKEEAAKNISAGASFDGFRPGKVPYMEVEKRYGELTIITESAKIAIIKKLPDFFAQNKIVPVEKPNIQIDSIATKSKAKFTVKLESILKADLPDLNNLFKDVKQPAAPKETSDKEVDEIILDIKKNIFREENKEKEMPKNDNDLPNLTIETIQKIYPSATSVENFREMIKKTVLQEKQTQNKYQTRKDITEKLLLNVDYDVPKIFIDRETENGLEMFKQDAKRLNTTIENYMKDKNLTEEDFKKMLRVEAEKRAKTQILFNFIAGENKIYPDENVVKEQVDSLQKKYKSVTKEHLEAYVHTAITNEKVFEYLEKIALKTDKDLKL